MRWWSVPRLWPGGTVAVLCSGPSMTQEMADRIHAAGIPAIAVNHTFRLAPWASILYAADAAWWNHTSGALEFPGIKVCCEEGVPTIERIQRAGTIGYTDDPMTVFSYGQSGAQAVQIGVKAGAQRVLVCGMDMTGTHWHGEHVAPLRNTSEELHAIFRDRMPALANALRIRGVEVLNCSPNSALDCWPKVSIDDAIARTLHAQ